MIQANELRIGNWVQHPDNPNPHQINAYGILSQSEKGLFTAVPLDESWLIRAGFKRGTKETFRSQTGFYSYIYLIGWPECDDPDMSLNLYFDDEGALYCALQDFNIAKIKFVHQLQNLFFALTGTELTFKDL